jgi:Flp pilus assembly protein TadB
VALSLLALLSFVTIGLVVAAVSLAIRDLVVGPAPASDSARSAVLPLRRLPLARHESVPRSAIGRFDQWFARLVLETGSEITPLTALLFLVFCGSLIGGAMFVWNESPLPATIGTLLGMVLSMMLLIYQRSRRIRLLQQQFPDALEMLARGTSWRELGSGGAVHRRQVARVRVEQRSPNPRAGKRQRPTGQTRR